MSPRSALALHALSLLMFSSLGGIGCKGSSDEPSKSDKSDKKKGDDDESSAKKKKAKDDDDNGAGGDALDPFVKKHLALAEKAASCDDGDANAAWCLAARGFEKGKPGLPKPGTLLGVTTFVQTKGASADTLEKYTHLSSLALRQSGSTTFGLISEVKPETKAERAEVTRVSGLLFQHFAGKSVQIGTNSELAGYLDGLPKTAKYELSEHASGHRFDGGSKADLRKVGKAWVSVEVPAKDPAGIWLSVFSALAYQ